MQSAVTASAEIREAVDAKQPPGKPAAPTEPAGTQPQDKNLPRSPQIQPPSPAASPRAAETREPAGTTAFRREKWLLAQDPESYTIQIMGVHNEQSLLDFIKRNQTLAQGEFAYYESLFQGEPWFQLLYGLYPTKQAAQLGADELPEDIRRGGPWIRRLATIQQTIRERRMQ
jgi:DamX protein